MGLSEPRRHWGPLHGGGIGWEANAPLSLSVVDEGAVSAGAGCANQSPQLASTWEAKTPPRIRQKTVVSRLRSIGERTAWKEGATFAA